MGLLSSIGKVVGSLSGATLGGAALQTLGGVYANQRQVSSAREQMAFQERMSSTAYQRAMADMRKAGLNPILAYQKGGASAPGGAQANIRNPLEGAATSAANYVAAQQATASIQQIKSQTALNNANSALALEKANTERVNQGLTTQTTAKEGYLTQQEKIRVQTAFAQLGKTRMESIQAEAAADRLILQGEIDRSEVGQLLSYIQRAKELGLGLDTVLGLLNKRKPGGRFPTLPRKSNNFTSKGFEVLE